MKTISEHRTKDESSQLPRKVPSFAQAEKVAARLSLTQPPLHNRAFPTMTTRAHPRHETLLELLACVANKAVLDN